MEREYRISTFNKIFYGIIVGGTMFFFAVILVLMSPNDKVSYLFVVLPLIICTLIFINLFKSKVIITETGVTRQRMFYNRTLYFDDIKGVRIESKIIIVEPKQSTEKNFRISNYGDLAGSDQLTNWLRESFTDLDNEDFEAEKAVLLEDASLGYTIKEREAKLSKMQSIAIAYSIVGGVLPLIMLFFDNPTPIFYMGFFYPLIGLVIIKFSNGLIRFITNLKRSAYSGIAIGFLMPVLILLVTAIKNFEIIFFSDPIKTSIIIALALFTLLYGVARNKATEIVKGRVLFMIIVSLLFGFGNAISANCLLDRSEPVKFITTVSDAYTTSGKGAHYHFKFAPWIKGQSEHKVDASYFDYQKTPIGSKVFIYQKKGLFNIPWFEYRIKPTPPAPADSGNESSPNPR